MIAAGYYDGRTARRHPVRLRIENREVRIEGEGIERRESLQTVRVSERMTGVPRKLTFADGAFCEAPDDASLQAVLRAGGQRPSWIEHLQVSWTAALGSVAVVSVLAVGFYLHGLPWLADRAAEHIPADVTRLMSQQTLDALDRFWLEPSTLPAQRRAGLQAAFAALQAPAGLATPYRLQFRSSPVIGANAFALPDGTLALLDELTLLADDDDQLLAVLAHELGHVHHRHGLRLLIRSTAVGTLSAWWFGDASALLAAAPAALAQARYSRDFETQADDHAASMLRANGIAPIRLAEILEKLMHAHGMETEPRDGDAAAPWADYLSSHPAPAERIQRLRQTTPP